MAETCDFPCPAFISVAWSGARLSIWNKSSSCVWMKYVDIIVWRWSLIDQPFFFSVERGTFLCVCAWPSLIIKHFGRRKQSKKAEQAEEETDQQMESNSGNTPTTKHYVQDERNLKSAATSLLVTASHLLLYLPALLLLGLQVRKQSIDVNQ